ncbi:AraC family transcriptional regulator [Sphingomonas sp. RB3P16]|uniref:AraC family transcriptional regulator n=1 Tax=Parasphingomonas frigoris TaxID=3096163 RepID=UPI002FCB043B
MIATSKHRSWTLLSSELRSHKVGEIPAFTTQDAEITQVIRDTGHATSTRSSGGVTQEVITAPDTMWLCPAGIKEEATRLSSDFPEVLHIYIPQHTFVQAQREWGLQCTAHNIRYECEVSDPIINNITREIVRELRNESSSGGLKIDALAIELITTLATDHLETSSKIPVALAKGLLDPKRLARVLHFIEDNLEEGISVKEIADAACFSQFHFMRAFQLAMGRSPHAYLSERRLDRAKHLLAYSDTPLVDISLTCQFSGQANFTKAFKRATGISPGRYRQACR